MRAYDAIEFRHALWHYFTQTGGGEERQAKKKIAIQLKKNLSFFHSHFLLSSFFPSEIFLINTSLIFYNSLLIFLNWKLFRRIFSYFLWFFFLTGRLNAGQILFHRCHKLSPSTNPTRRNSKLQKRRHGEPLPRDRTSLTILLNIG